MAIQVHDKFPRSLEAQSVAIVIEYLFIAKSFQGPIIKRRVSRVPARERVVSRRSSSR
jgi:hypothetical protein